jgi:Trk K+ transport system NAD-binding subunit
MTAPRHTTNAAGQSADAETFVVGGGLAGLEVATRLLADGESVTLVDPHPPTDPPRGLSVHEAQSPTAESLGDAGLDRADTVVVLGADDARNLLVVQLARTRFGVDRVIVRVNDSGRAAAFDRPGVETVDTPTAIAQTAVDLW